MYFLFVGLNGMLLDKFGLYFFVMIECFLFGNNFWGDFFLMIDNMVNLWYLNLVNNCFMGLILKGIGLIFML